MKKLMFAALAVAGMSAVAADFKPVAVEKLTLSFKQVNKEKVESVKYNGFVFTSDKGEQKAVIWNKKAQLACVTNETAFGKSVNLKKVYEIVPPYVVADYATEIFSGAKKAGKSISFAKDYVGYGSGTYAAGTGFLIEKESISGNIVNQKTREYGTWKLAYDKSTVKKLEGKYTIKDVLVKNKVEFWDL